MFTHERVNYFLFKYPCFHYIMQKLSSFFISICLHASSRTADSDIDYLEKQQMCFNGCMKLIQDLKINIKHLYQILEHKNEVNKCEIDCYIQMGNINKEPEHCSCFYINPDGYMRMSLTNNLEAINTSNKFCSKCEKKYDSDITEIIEDKIINTVEQNESSGHFISDDKLEVNLQKKQKKVQFSEAEDICFFDPTDNQETKGLHCNIKRKLGFRRKFRKFTIQKKAEDQKIMSASSFVLDL